MTRTWPDDWDARKRGVGCWFCGDRSYFGKPFYVGSAGDAHLEPHPISRGHAIVVFRDRHVADFTSLTTEEVTAYWRDVHAVALMIERVFAPCHMNYQLLGRGAPSRREVPSRQAVSPRPSVPSRLARAGWPPTVVSLRLRVPSSAHPTGCSSSRGCPRGTRTRRPSRPGG